MAADYEGFEADFRSDSGEEGGVSFADGEAGGEGGAGGGRFDSVVEEGHNVVKDVVVKPGEDCSGFVGERRKWSCELSCQPID